MTITMIKLVVVFMLIGIVAITGCKRHHIHICDPDEEQCITVIDPAYRDIRYVIDGKHLSVPDSNYIKLKISTGEYPLDGIYICWENESYEWEVIVVKTIEISENKLNQNRFLFYRELDRDERGVPTAERFMKPGCVTIGLYDRYYDGYRIVPKGHAIVFDKTK